MVGYGRVPIPRPCPAQGRRFETDHPLQDSPVKLSIFHAPPSAIEVGAQLRHPRITLWTRLVVRRFTALTLHSLKNLRGQPCRARRERECRRPEPRRVQRGPNRGMPSGTSFPERLTGLQDSGGCRPHTPAGKGSQLIFTPLERCGNGSVGAAAPSDYFSGEIGGYINPERFAELRMANADHLVIH
jgi:hypothetical protein